MKQGYIKRSEKNPGAILNTDSTGLQNYKKMKNRYKHMQDELNDLKNQVSEIFELLKKEKNDS